MGEMPLPSLRTTTNHHIPELKRKETGRERKKDVKHHGNSGGKMYDRKFLVLASALCRWTGWCIHCTHTWSMDEWVGGWIWTDTGRRMEERGGSSVREEKATQETVSSNSGPDDVRVHKRVLLTQRHERTYSRTCMNPSIYGNRQTIAIWIHWTERRQKIMYRFNDIMYVYITLNANKHQTSTINPYIYKLLQDKQTPGTYTRKAQTLATCMSQLLRLVIYSTCIHVFVHAHARAVARLIY